MYFVAQSRIFTKNDGRISKHITLLSWLLLLCSCSHISREEFYEVKKQMAEMRQQQSQADTKIDTMNERLFLLNDRVESSAMAMQRAGLPGNLKVVKLTVEREPAAQAAGKPAVPPLPAARAKGPAISEPSYEDIEKLPAAGKRELGIETAEEKFRKGENMDSPGYDTEPVKLYNEGLVFLKEKNYGKAAVALDQFAKRFPEHEYADNALYWLGECYYDQKEYSLAIDEFQKVILQYPSGNKVPDALLKIAFSSEKLGDLNTAKSMLFQLVDIYPLSDAAKLAKEKLKELK